MLRILFVDDDFAVAEVARLVLEHEGFTITLASNGEEALHSVQSDRPDLVITDYMMPIMNGGELVRRMCADPVLKTIPIIMITANSKNEIASADNCAMVLTKPITVDQLLDAVKKVLR